MNKTTKYIKQLMATTDQEVTGLNPVGVTRKSSTCKGICECFFCNLNFAVKICRKTYFVLLFRLIKHSFTTTKLHFF